MRTKHSLPAFLLILMTGFLVYLSPHAAANAAQRTAAAQTELSSELQRNFSLLDSIGTCPGTAMIREYVIGRAAYLSGKKHVRDVAGREYATDMPLDKAVSVVTEFYERKLLAQGGWKTLQVHAATSCWEKRNQVLCLMRSGPDDPGLPPGARLLKETTLPANAKFFFSIEVAPK